MGDTGKEPSDVENVYFLGENATLPISPELHERLAHRRLPLSRAELDAKDRRARERLQALREEKLSKLRAHNQRVKEVALEIKQQRLTMASSGSGSSSRPSSSANGQTSQSGLPIDQHAKSTNGSALLLKGQRFSRRQLMARLLY